MTAGGTLGHTHGGSFPRLLVAAAACLLIGFSLFFFVDTAHIFPPSALVSGQRPWHIRGNVHLVSIDPSDAGLLPTKVLLHPDLRLWVALSSPDGGSTIRSPSFQAKRYLFIPLGGVAAHPGLELSVERLDTGQRLSLSPTVREQWQLAFFEVPDAWRGATVQLAAESRSSESPAWFGVGTPFGFSSMVGLQHRLLPPLAPFGVAVVLLLSAGLFATTAAAGVSMLHERLAIGAPMSLLLMFGGFAAAGYLLFWCYLVHPLAGRAAAALLMAGGVGICLTGVDRGRIRGFLASIDVRQPAVLTLAISFFYLTAVYTYHPDPWGWDWMVTVYRRLGHAGDNLIPQVLAQRLYEGADLRQPIFGQWQASDRPPLQTGIVLIQYPLWAALEKHALMPNLIDAYYQVFSTLLQCSWVAAAWALMRAAALSPGKASAVVLALAPTGFFYVNSVFVWPKMLAGALGVGAFLLLLDRRGGKKGGFGQVAAGAVFATLAFVAHGAAAFALFGLSLVLLLPGLFPGWRKTAAGAGLFLALYAPWAGFQQIYDPPGDRLLKWHLADVTAQDHRSAWKIIRDHYTGLTLHRWLQRKADFLRTIVGLKTRPGWPQDDGRDLLRRLQFWCLLPALGLLNVGWGALGVYLFQRGRGRRDESDPTVRLLGASLLSLLVWMLLLASEAAVIHAPYTPLIVLFAALSIFLVRCHLPGVWALFTVHAVLGLFLWAAMSKTTGLVIWWENHLAVPEYLFDPAMAAAAAAVPAGLVLWAGGRILLARRANSKSEWS